ncbi:VOC family protein [Egicoccus sp. AB-alg6-2]|uniref:VOC family protein n=1 Tax=Egicoccus sp. AB-alg6-2 TaxID=3242692 RepID=UPI00359DBF62
MDHTEVSAVDVAALDDLRDWRVLLGAIHAEFRAGSFSAAAALAASIAEAADAADHHPDLDLRYPDRLRVSLVSHAAGTLTDRDVALARHVNALADDAGASPGPADLQALEIALDTMDADRIRPFWAAVLGYVDDRGALVDPLRLGPALWFQQMDQPRTQRNRFHLDVTVPHDQADARIAAALAAGGTMVEDRHARAFWVLADAEGNEACVCTWQDRGDG